MFYNLIFLVKFIVFLLFPSSIMNFKYFKAFNLLSNYLLIISDEGFIKYNPESEGQIIIESLNAIKNEQDLDFITVAQFPINEGGYIICRIQENIFFFLKI